MKLLGGSATDERNVVRDTQSRSQDDANVGYVFQRGPHQHETEFSQFSQKQPQSRWTSGDDAVDNQDKWKFGMSINSNINPGTIEVGVGGNVMSGGTTAIGPVSGGNMCATVGMSMQQTSSKQQIPQIINHHPHPSHQQLPNHLNTPNHMNSTVLNHALNNPVAAAAAAAGLPVPMPTIQGNIYDHMHPNVNMNGVGIPKPPGPPAPQEQLVYLGGQPQFGMLAPQNQYMTAANRNSAAMTASTAKKLWEKSDMKGPVSSSGPLNPLHIPGVADPGAVWKDSTWSTQGETILAPPRSRTFPQVPDPNPTGSAGILSPRDSTSGLGVKMVEYVLGGSPTNKESPLSGLEPRLRTLKFDDNDKSHDDKEKSNSPFDSNGLKKEDQVATSNGVVVNGIDDDKSFNRTPGSRQPSPAEESLARPPTLLDSQSHMGSVFPQHPLHHMLGSSMEHQGSTAPQLNSYHHHQLPMNQLQPQVLNGVGGIQMTQNAMVNQTQGSNQMESSGNLLQQPPNFDVQQLFRSQNPGLAAATNAATPGAASGAPLPQPLPMASQQFLAAQQNAYATQQAAPYVINPGQEAAPYMGLIAAQMPQYYGVAPWGVYPGNLIPQQGSQPRRPLTPSQQGPENQSYQVIPAFFDQSGSLVMGPRTGTPMRLVSPAPVLVPPGAGRAPPQAPQIYPPQPQTAQQNPMYSTQNGSNVGANGLFAPQAFTGGLGTLGSPAQTSGLALNNSSLTARRDSFDRNTSVFSPSLDYNTNVTSTAVSSTAAAAAARKWPVGNYGALGTVATASASPIGAPITPPPSGLVTNRAPGAETKFRNVNQLPAAVGLSAANAMFGSNSSLFSKHLQIPSAVAGNVTAGNGGGGSGGGGNGTSNIRQAVPLDRPPGRSRLLEDFRNQRYPNLQLRDLANHIVEFSQDQHGSRFIQQKLERATAVEKQMVFNEILGAAYSLMTDVFGNYVIQKFFEFGTPEQKATLAQQVKGHVLQLALQMYGCRVIQKALESISSEQQQEIVRELDGHVLKCVKDQNGNHVVQKCIECVEPSALQFIINAFKGQVYSLSTHPYGCRVIQRILEHCTSEQTAPILDELHENTDQLIQDQYGNYVIQHVLEHGKQEDKSVLIAGVRGKVLVLSQHKFASNVVEKCVTHATRTERTQLIDEVCTFNDSALHVMMKDQFANYVVQKMIDVSEPTQLKKLMNKIRPHMASLRKYTYGKHINAKLEKFYMKTSNPVGTSASSAATSLTNSSTEGGNNGGLGQLCPPANGVL